MLKPIQFLLSVVLLASSIASAEPPPDPFEIVRLASDRLSNASSFSFHIEKRFDVVLNDGAKAEYSGALDVMATRSRGLYMDYGDDVSAKRVWYDGRTMTILDSLKNLYVTVNAVGTVSEALTRIELDYGAKMPLAPLLKKKLLEHLKPIQRSSYLGIHDAEGDPCHHLLFRGERVDIQIWITTDDTSLMRKLVVTFWEIEGSPQQSLTFSDWNLEADIGPDAFNPKLPEGAMEIEFLPKGGK
jgi:hypothetical protein